MNNFKIGDIVLFSWKPKYAPWRKGKVVANNFEMCNLPDFFGKPVYYISEVDENNNVLDQRKSVAIDKDSEYILKFLPGMEAMIGKSTYIKNIYTIDIEKEFPEQVADTDYVRWKNQFKNVSKADYLEIPGLKEMYDDEQKWKEEIEKKLDDIIRTLNLLLLCGKTTTDPYPYIPQQPWYNPYNPEKYDPERWKIYCEHNDHVYEIKTSNKTTSTFDFNSYNNAKYNDNVSITNGEKNCEYVEPCVDLPNIPHSTMYGNEVLDNSKINKSNNKK